MGNLHIIGNDVAPLVPPPPKEGRIYLAGPVTGVPDFNRRGFATAESMLLEDGYRVVNPLNMTEEHDDMNDIPRGSETWDTYMRIALRGLLACQTIVMLPGWTTSRGAKVELTLATSLGMGVFQILTQSQILVNLGHTMPGGSGSTIPSASFEAPIPNDSPRGRHRDQGSSE